MKVLVVDPDAKSARLLGRELRAGGFVADSAVDGETGLHRARASDYDLIVMEVTLPGRDGWDIVRELRSTGNQTPLIFVSKRGAVEDRVRGLDLGADDYLVKPFAFNEFMARIRSILRRAPQRRPDLLRIGELEIDLLRRTVSRAGRRVNLTRKEFELLLALARRPGQAVPNARLIEQVWDMNYRVESNTLAVHMGRLRSKIDAPFEHKLIRVDRGVGYRLLDR